MVKITVGQSSSHVNKYAAVSNPIQTTRIKTRAFVLFGKSPHMLLTRQLIVHIDQFVGVSAFNSILSFIRNCNNYIKMPACSRRTFDSHVQ